MANLIVLGMILVGVTNLLIELLLLSKATIKHLDSALRKNIEGAN